MAHPSTQPDTTELVKQLLEQLAIGWAHGKQAVALDTLTDHHSQTEEAVQELKTSHGKFVAQQTLIQDQNDKLFEDVRKQLSIIQSMEFEITDLRNKKEELQATVITIQNDLQGLRLQIAALDGIRVLREEFLPNATSSLKTSAQRHGQFEDEAAVIIDADTAAEPDIPPSDRDISMAHTSEIVLEVPVLSTNGPRNKTTPELMLPPPAFRTPKNSIIHGMPSPDTIGTMMPDTPGIHRYNGPAQVPPKPVFLKHPEPIDENSHKRAKRARRQSIIPREISILSPITESTNEQSVLERVRGIDKTLWRETWEQRGKPGTLEDFVRQNKVAILQSDITNGTTHSDERQPASDFEQMIAPQQNTRKRAYHQPNSAQPVIAACDMSVPQPSLKTMTRETVSQPRRTARASVVPSRFAGDDVYTGKKFLTTTTSRHVNSNFKKEATQPCGETADAPRKVHFDGDEEEGTPGKAASILLEQFGGRKTKIPKNPATLKNE